MKGVETHTYRIWKTSEGKLHANFLSKSDSKINSFMLLKSGLTFKELESGAKWISRGYLGEAGEPRRNSNFELFKTLLSQTLIIIFRLNFWSLKFLDLS